MAASILIKDLDPIHNMNQPRSKRSKSSHPLDQNSKQLIAHLAIRTP